MTDRLQYAFLEVGRFDKPKEECTAFEDQFLYLMKNLPTFAEEPELWNDPYFYEMMEEAEYANMTAEQRYKYAMSMKQKWDFANQINYAKETSFEEGFEKGRKTNVQENSLEIARNLHDLGVSEEIILSATKLTEEQLRAIQNEA